MMDTEKVRILAYYLPQFHPIPENDEWWGKGFTEWTNVCKAKPLFKGHYQPRLPADLGYYDLRVSETRVAQANLAQEYGIEGFCYWHYWFGNGKQLLERPFEEVLKSKEPDFPFCLAWANESWKGLSHGLKNRKILIEQQYPGVFDYENHFYSLLSAFKDKRYIKVDNKPVFVIFKPLESPEIKVFINLWRKLAVENNLNGIYFIGISDEFNPIDLVLSTGVDAINTIRLNNMLINKLSLSKKIINYIRKKIRISPNIISYKDASIFFNDDTIDKIENVFPTIIPNWDHTPRSGYDGLVLSNSTPELFKTHVKTVLKMVNKKEQEHRIVFIKSWNEWAEGNYLEPDTKFGLKYLEALKDCL